MIVGFALAMLIVSVVLNALLLVAWRRESEHARRLDRDRRIGELEREMSMSLTSLSEAERGSLAHLLGVLVGLWIVRRR